MSKLAPGAGRLIRHLEGLNVPTTRERFRVEAWQRKFLHGAYKQGTLRAALSVARSQGKTTMLGGVVSAYAPGAPLYREGGEVLIVSQDIRAAEQPFGRALEFLNPAGKDWAIRRSVGRLEARHKPSGFRVLALPCRARSCHGFHPILVACDEPSQWAPHESADVFDVLTTSLGKVPGARMISVGTYPGDPDSWFRAELENPPEGVYVQTHRAPSSDLTPFNLRIANPAMRTRPQLAARLKAEMKAAASSSDAGNFIAYVLNRGDRYGQRDPLTTRELWEAIQGEGVKPEGDYIMGIDWGGGRSWSAACAFHLDSRTLVGFAAIGMEPSLAERASREAMLPSDFEMMIDRGELIQTPGRMPKAEDVLKAAIERWGEPVAIVADRYREAETRDAVAACGLDHVDLEFRGMGAKDGAADCVAFQAAVANEEFSVPPNFALSTHIVHSQVRWTLGNMPVLVKSGRGNDDLAAAAVLAIGYAARNAPAREEVWEPIDCSPEAARGLA